MDKHKLVMLEILFVSLAILVVSSAALLFVLDTFNTDWRPRKCIDTLGVVVDCPVEFGGAPPPLDNFTFNITRGAG
jgi:hypothetical protein